MKSFLYLYIKIGTGLIEVGMEGMVEEKRFLKMGGFFQ